MFVFSGARSGVSLCSFSTVIGTPAGIASASINLVFIISNKIVKYGKENNKQRKITLLTKTKLNSIEKKISKALIDSDISHNEFTLVINEKKNVSG